MVWIGVWSGVSREGKVVSWSSGCSGVVLGVGSFDRGLLLSVELIVWSFSFCVVRSFC